MTEVHLAFDHPEQDLSGKKLIAKENLKGTAGNLTPGSFLDVSKLERTTPRVTATLLAQLLTQSTAHSAPHSAAHSAAQLLTPQYIVTTP